MDPHLTPEVEFNYVDIGAVDGRTGRVVTTKRMPGKETPSRARQEVRQGDVLFSTVRPYLRAIALIHAVPNAVASTGFCVLRPALGIDPRYLFHALRSDSFVEQVLPHQRGSSYPAVRNQDVLAQVIEVPPTLEQSRIAAAVDELFSDLDDGLSELKSADLKLCQYRQSLLKAAVEGALTAEWRKRNPPQETGVELLARILRERRARWEALQLKRFSDEGIRPRDGWQTKYPVPTAPQVEGLPPLPEHWTWASAEQLCGFITKGTS